MMQTRVWMLLVALLRCGINALWQVRGAGLKMSTRCILSAGVHRAC